MSERTALEIASRLEALIPIAGGLAVEALRRQHAEIERLKTVPMKYRRMAFNAQLQEENAQLSEKIERLRAQVKRLRDALVGMVADDDVNGLRFTAAVLESMDCDDATVSLAAVRALIDIRPEGSAGEEKP